MPDENVSSLLELLAAAETPEDVEAVEALWLEATGGVAPRQRIVTQEAAARALGVARPRLREMERTAKWWRPEFRTAEGYDVEAITAAQAAYLGESKASEPGWREREQAARAQLLEQKQRAAELEWQRRQGNVLPADVYQEFVRELLGLLRSALEELPADLADDVPPDVRQYIFIPPEQQVEGTQPAPLQRAIARLLDDVDDWLAEDPGEEAAAE